MHVCVEFLTFKYFKKAYLSLNIFREKILMYSKNLLLLIYLEVFKEECSCLKHYLMKFVKYEQKCKNEKHEIDKIINIIKNHFVKTLMWLFKHTNNKNKSMHMYIKAKNINKELIIIINIIAKKILFSKFQNYESNEPLK